MAEYQALLETRCLLASEGLGFSFRTLDSLIDEVTAHLCDDAVVANKVRSFPRQLGSGYVWHWLADLARTTLGFEVPGHGNRRHAAAESYEGRRRE